MKQIYYYIRCIPLAISMLCGAYTAIKGELVGTIFLSSLIIANTLLLIFHKEGGEG